MSLWTPDGERPIRREAPAPADNGRAPGGDGMSLSPEQLGELAQMAGIDLSTLTPDQRADVEQQLIAMATEMAAAQERLLQTPVADVIANHLAGFYELASLHLSNQPPDFASAAVAIDALHAVVSRLEGKLGENETALREMLRVAQSQFVRLKDAVTPTEPDA